MFEPKSENVARLEQSPSTWEGGAGGGSRTRNPLRGTDFKSAVYAIPPLRRYLIRDSHFRRGLAKTRLASLNHRNRKPSFQQGKW